LLAEAKTKLREEALQLQLQVGKARIPRILLGTSPFIGAGQFGVRAPVYYDKFFRRPENIARIMRRALEFGVCGIQALPYPPVFQAVKEVEKDFKGDIAVVGTVSAEDPLFDIQRFQDFNTAAMVLHGEISDGKDRSLISKLLDEIRSTGCLAGLATHSPLSTLNWLLESKLDFDIIMLPFNKLGAFMDADPKQIAQALSRLHKPAIYNLL
jgi:hypothetical protein